MAFLAIFVYGCKKENQQTIETSSQIEKKEIADFSKKEIVSSVVDPTSPGAPGGGADTYPHNTGACVCGKYASCYPYEYWTFEDKTDGTVRTVRHLTAYGQTTFPSGAYFPGNRSDYD